MLMTKEQTYDNRSTSTTTTTTTTQTNNNNNNSNNSPTLSSYYFRLLRSPSTLNSFRERFNPFNHNINPFLHQQQQQEQQQQQQQREDVTDNKTDYLIYSNNNNRTTIMVDQLNNEFERLKTFNNWPLDYMDKTILAKIGMYYYGETDKVKCYFCDVIIGRWELDDNPIQEHIRWSPNCPLLKRRTTNNQPIDIESLDRLLPPISYDVCGSNDMIEVRPAAYAEGTIHTPSATATTTPTIFSSSSMALHQTPISSPNYLNLTNSTLTTNNSSSSGGQQQNFVYPDHPEYAIESARLRSYNDCWPITMKQKPEQLSEAGFFYTGIGDRVKCFSCGGGLKDWDNNDEPWEQHALWLSNCRYLKLIKGINFIENIKEKYKNNDNNELTNQLSSSTSSTSSTSSSPSKESRTTSTSTETNSDDDINNEYSNKNCCNNKNNVNFNNNNNNNNNINSNCCNLNINNCSAGCDDQQQQQHQHNSKKQISDDKLCKICYAGEYNTAFLPCGHVVACAKCASSVTKCPMCRKPFTDVMRVYFS